MLRLEKKKKETNILPNSVQRLFTRDILFVNYSIVPLIRVLKRLMHNLIINNGYYKVAIFTVVLTMAVQISVCMRSMRVRR